MKLSDVQKQRAYGIVVSARVPLDVKKTITKKRINLGKLITYAVRELK